jgi:hypothetical protein
MDIFGGRKLAHISPMRRFESVAFARIASRSIMVCPSISIASKGTTQIQSRTEATTGRRSWLLLPRKMGVDISGSFERAKTAAR